MIADRYGDERAVTGVTLVLPRHKLLAFGSLESGRNGIDLRRFQQETGMRIPAAQKNTVATTGANVLGIMAPAALPGP